MDRRTFLTRQTSAALSRRVDASAAGSRRELGAAYFSNAVLTTHEGRTVRFYDDLLKGKVVLINFMYTGCGEICPGMTQNLAEVQSLLGGQVGKDIFIYSLTLQPELDTPASLAYYARLFNCGPGWLFLTGAAADMESLRRRLGFYDIVPSVDAELEEHIGVVRFGNEPLQRWGACPALAAPSVIAESVRRVMPSRRPG